MKDEIEKNINQEKDRTHKRAIKKWESNWIKKLNEINFLRMKLKTI